MKSKPLVSVIIPTYNAEEYIAETLNSILKQTYRNLEVIVVDDGSTDRTSQIIKDYGSQVCYFYHHQNSGGGSVPRNTGIIKSSGEFICFNDADDLMDEDRVALQVDFLERHPEVGLVFCDYRNFDKKGLYQESHFQTCPLVWSQLRGKEELILKNPCRLLAKENFGSAGTFLMRRNLLKLESEFKTSLKSCEDFHFYYRLARHGPIGIVNKVGMYRRLHDANMTKNKFMMITMAIKARSNLYETEKDPVARILLRKKIASLWSSLSRLHANKGKYLQAFWYEWKAFSKDMCYPQLAISLRSFARTTLIALGIHRPKEL